MLMEIYVYKKSIIGKINSVKAIRFERRIINEIKRVSKNEGYIYIIDWDKRDMKMGPPVNERISKEEVKKIAKSSGITFLEEVNINGEYYGLIFKV